MRLPSRQRLTTLLATEPHRLQTRPDNRLPPGQQTPISREQRKHHRTNRKRHRLHLVQRL
ncbi:MAG: hypothetical protein ACFBSG_11675 [Leptolyngbyaceae cyanobacterium]